MNENVEQFDYERDTHALRDLPRQVHLLTAAVEQKCLEVQSLTAENKRLREALEAIRLSAEINAGGAAMGRIEDLCDAALAEREKE